LAEFPPSGFGLRRRHALDVVRGGFKGRALFRHIDIQHVEGAAQTRQQCAPTGRSRGQIESWSRHAGMIARGPHGASPRSCDPAWRALALNRRQRAIRHRILS